MPNTKVTFKSLADELGVDESAMKTLLNSKGLDVSDLTDAQKKAVQSQLSTSIQMNTPNLQPLTPKTSLTLNGDAPKVTLPSSNAVDTVENAKDRREVAAATVMTSGQDAVSRVLEQATKKANDLIESKIDSLSDTLAAQMAKTMEDEILSSVGFFGQMLTQGTTRIHKQIEEVMEGELVA